MLKYKTTRRWFLILLFVLFLGVFGGLFAPYPADENIYRNGELQRNNPPSLEHPMGTTSTGQDIFSRIVIGARPTVITGLIGGSMIFGIGTTIGLVSGYIGGRVDHLLMRFTDLMYGVPLIPFAIVLTALFGIGFYESVLVIGIVLWRGLARVIRAQTLQLREEPFVEAAEAAGGSTFYVIGKHILPNVAPMGVLYFALGTGQSIVIQAGLAFLGLSDAGVPSWGIMIRNAYKSGYMMDSWWWSITTGSLLAITVLATYMFGHGYERMTKDAEGEALARIG